MRRGDGSWLLRRRAFDELAPRDESGDWHPAEVRRVELAEPATASGPAPRALREEDFAALRERVVSLAAQHSHRVAHTESLLLRSRAARAARLSRRG